MWNLSSIEQDKDDKTPLPPIIKFDTDSYLFLLVILIGATWGLCAWFVMKVFPEAFNVGPNALIPVTVVPQLATRLSLGSWSIGVIATVVFIITPWLVCIVGNKHIIKRHDAGAIYSWISLELLAGIGIVLAAVVLGAVCVTFLTGIILGFFRPAPSKALVSVKPFLFVCIIYSLLLMCVQFQETNTLLWASRVADPLSRVTPVMPCILLTASLCLLSHSWIKSFLSVNTEGAVSGWQPIANGKDMDKATLKSLAEYSQRLDDCNERQWYKWKPFAVGAIALLWIPYMYFFRSVPGIDHPWVNRVLWMLIAFFSVHWVWAFIITNQLRSQYTNVLQSLATSTLRDAFNSDKLPMECGSFVGRSLFDMRRPSNRQRSIAMRALEGADSCSEKELQETSRKIWENPSFLSHPKNREFLAIRALSYVAQWGAILKWRIMALVIGAILFVLAVNSYPMQPKGMLVSTGLWMMVAGSILFLVTNWKIETSELLSRVTGTDPHHVTPDLRFFLESFAALIPVAILLIGNTFPSIWNWAATVIEPALNTIR